MVVLIPKIKLSELEGLLPEATYEVRVDNVQYVAAPKKDGASPYIRATHVITGPDQRFVGRKVFENLPREGGGSHRLRELLTARGHPEDFELEDTDQLIGLQFHGIVAIEKGEGGYADKNVVKRHMSLLG
jgi:hypothetical protein